MSEGVRERCGILLALSEGVRGRCGIFLAVSEEGVVYSLLCQRKVTGTMRAARVRQGNCGGITMMHWSPAFTCCDDYMATGAASVSSCQFILAEFRSYQL